MPKTSACGLRRKRPARSSRNRPNVSTADQRHPITSHQSFREFPNSFSLLQLRRHLLIRARLQDSLDAIKTIETTERLNFSDLTTMHSESFHRHPLSPAEDRMVRSRWKRAVDLAGCIAALPLLGAVTLFAAVVVGFTSPGPLFFQQPAIGNKGRRFGLYRMRTMHVRCSRAKHGSERPPYFAGGRWLHISGLANLPQIINVWRGETSMIGPRPKAGVAGEVIPTA